MICHGFFGNHLHNAWGARAQKPLTPSVSLQHAIQRVNCPFLHHRFVWIVWNAFSGVSPHQKGVANRRALQLRVGHPSLVDPSDAFWKRHGEMQRTGETGEEPPAFLGLNTWKWACLVAWFLDVSMQRLLLLRKEKASSNKKDWNKTNFSTFDGSNKNRLQGKHSLRLRRFSVSFPPHLRTIYGHVIFLCHAGRRDIAVQCLEQNTLTLRSARRPHRWQPRHAMSTSDLWNANDWESVRNEKLKQTETCFGIQQRCKHLKKPPSKKACNNYIKQNPCVGVGVVENGSTMI